MNVTSTPPCSRATVLGAPLTSVQALPPTYKYLKTLSKVIFSRSDVLKPTAPLSQVLKSQLAKWYTISFISGHLLKQALSLSSNSSNVEMPPCTCAALSVSKMFFIREKSLSAISVCECPASKMNHCTSCQHPT